MASLAVVLNVAPGELLNPEQQSVHLDLGMTGPVRRNQASAWARGLLRITIEGDKYVFERTMDDLEPTARTFEWLRMVARDAEAESWEGTSRSARPALGGSMHPVDSMMLASASASPGPCAAHVETQSGTHEAPTRDRPRNGCLSSGNATWLGRRGSLQDKRVRPVKAEIAGSKPVGRAGERVGDGSLVLSGRSGR
jgi:hypothetical protein